MKDVMKKIRALLESAGRTEEEAMTAIEMANKLMVKHGITLEELEAVGDDDFLHEGVNVYSGRKAHEVQWVANAIAEFTSTRVYLSPSSGKIMYFGLESDVEFARWLTSMIKDLMEREWKAYLNSPERPRHIHGRTLRKSFMVGMSSRIAARMRSMRTRPEGSGSRELVVAKRALVERKFRELPLLLQKSYGSVTYNPNSAYYAGQRAGDSVQFSRPVGGHGGSTRLLK